MNNGSAVLSCTTESSTYPLIMKFNNCLLKISNNSKFDMKFSSEWFEHGRVADGFDWPRVIKAGSFSQTLCYERDFSLLGCSGLVKYKMGSTEGSPEVTISFSNPVLGFSKLNVGTGGIEVWNNMTDDHDYRSFDVFLDISGRNLMFRCKCTSGFTNICTVEIEETN